MLNILMIARVHFQPFLNCYPWILIPISKHQFRQSAVENLIPLSMNVIPNIRARLLESKLEKPCQPYSLSVSNNSGNLAC